MATQKAISGLPAAGALDGSELVEGVQAGGSVKMTAAAIAALAAGGGGAPVQIVFAWCAFDAAVAVGDVIDGATLRLIPNRGTLDLAYGGRQPAYPVVVGTPLSGDWVALDAIMSATTYGAGPPTGAVGGFFIKDNAAAGSTLLNPEYVGIGNLALAANHGYAKRLPLVTDPDETWTLPATPADGDHVFLVLAVLSAGALGNVTLDGNGKNIQNSTSGSAAAPTVAMAGATFFAGVNVNLYYSGALGHWLLGA